MTLPRVPSIPVVHTLSLLPHTDGRTDSHYALPGALRRRPDPGLALHPWSHQGPACPFRGATQDLAAGLHLEGECFMLRGRINLGYFFHVGGFEA